MEYYYPEEGYLIDEQGRLLVPLEEQYDDEQEPEEDLDEFVSLWEPHIPSSTLDWKWTSSLIWTEFTEEFIEKNIPLENNIPMNKGMTLNTANFSDSKLKSSSIPSLPPIKTQPEPAASTTKPFNSSQYTSSLVFSNASIVSNFSYHNIFIQLLRMDVFENPKFKCHFATLNLAESRAFRKTQISQGWFPYTSIFFVNYPTPYTIQVILEHSVSLPKRSRIRPLGKLNPRDHTKWTQVAVLHAYYSPLNIAGVCPIYVDYTGSPDRYNLIPYYSYYDDVNKELNKTVGGTNPHNQQNDTGNILDYVSTTRFHPSQLSGERHNFGSTIKVIQPANGFRRFSEFSSYGVKQYYVLKKFYSNNLHLDNNDGKGYSYTIEEGPICYAKKNWKIIASFYGFQSPLKGSICIRVYKTNYPFPRMKLMVGDDEDDEEGNQTVWEGQVDQSLSAHFENKKFMYTRKYTEDFNKKYIEPLKQDKERNYLYNKENFKHFKHNTNRRNDFNTEWTEVLKFHTFDIPFPGSSKLFLYHTIRAIDNNISPCYRHKLTPLFNKNYSLDGKAKKKDRKVQKSNQKDDIEEEPDEDTDKGLWDLRSVFYVLPAELEDCTILPYQSRPM